MNNRMRVPLARRIASGELNNFHGGLIMPAARMVVAQAEQIERLQAALNEIEDWGMNVLAPLVGVGIILPGDMEEVVD